MLRIQTYQKFSRIFLLLLVLGMPVRIFATASLSNSTLDQAVDALLKGNWQEAADILQKDDKSAADPIARLVMGHVSIAINQNNAALRLFISVEADARFKSWLEWTSILLEEHPEHYFALYLAADARARMQEFSEAETLFTKALQLKPDFGLAYCGRGVTYFMQEKEDLAMLDFVKAVAISPNLAEAHANMGTYWVFKEAPEGALTAFEKAIEINPEFALAYNGRGCVHFGCGRFEDAIQDFRQAYLLCDDLVLAEINKSYAEACILHTQNLADVAMSPGMTMESVVKEQKSRLEFRQAEINREVPDESFQRNISAFAHLSDNDRAVFIKKYGSDTVEKAVRIEMERLASDMSGMNQEVQNMQQGIERLTFMAKVIKTVQTARSLISTISSVTKNAKKIEEEGWKPFLRKTGLQVGKAASVSTANNRILTTVSDAIPTSLDPPSLIDSTVDSSLNIADSVVDDKLGAIQTNQIRLADNVSFKGLQFRNLNNAYNITFREPSQFIPRPQPRVNGASVVTSSQPINPKYQGAIRPQISPPTNVRTFNPPRNNPRPNINQRQMDRISGLASKPGGISTKEIAEAFVDKGNWPVRSIFGLFYGSEIGNEDAQSTSKDGTQDR